MASRNNASDYLQFQKLMRPAAAISETSIIFAAMWDILQSPHSYKKVPYYTEDTLHSKTTPLNFFSPITVSQRPDEHLLFYLIKI